MAGFCDVMVSDQLYRRARNNASFQDIWLFLSDKSSNFSCDTEKVNSNVYVSGNLDLHEVNKQSV